MPEPNAVLRESRWSTPIELTDAEADALVALGRRLAGSKDWWGAPAGKDDEQRSAGIIECRHLAGSARQIRVHNAVGVITIGGRVFHVEPKIPSSHYLYLLDRSELLPRRDDQKIGLQSGESLWTLMARWYVAALAGVLQADLIRDYHPVRETLPLVRGKVQPTNTSRNFLKGRPAFDVEFEEFDTNNPVNRVLKAAARSISASAPLPMEVRRTAQRHASLMCEVDDLQPGDLHAQVDVRTAYYSDALGLARHIIRRQGRNLELGSSAAWAFLLHSPPAIEAGIRSILTIGMADLARLTKRGRQLPPSTLTLNPDLVFDEGTAVGDVKYSRTNGSWARPHLYQATTFATGYNAKQAVVVGFRAPGTTRNPPVLRIGGVTLSYLSWNADPSIGGQEAADALIGDCRAWWLRSLSPPDA